MTDTFLDRLLRLAPPHVVVMQDSATTVLPASAYASGVLLLTGPLSGGSAILQLPHELGPAFHGWIVDNSTGQTVTVVGPSGASTAVPNGGRRLVFSDGSNIRQVDGAGVGGGDGGLGAVTLTGTPSSGMVPVASDATNAAWALPTRLGPVVAGGTAAAGHFLVAASATSAAWQAPPSIIGPVAVSGTPTAGQVPIASSGTAAAWGTPAASNANGGVLASATHTATSGLFRTNIYTVPSIGTGRAIIEDVYVRLSTALVGSGSVVISAALGVGGGVDLINEVTIDSSTLVGVVAGHLTSTLGTSMLASQGYRAVANGAQVISFQTVASGTITTYPVFGIWIKGVYLS